MKIIVICRTLNEERNIEQFCRCYQWADQIVIADAWSEDNTVSIALRFPNVWTYKFAPVVYKNDTYRSPHGEHLNYLIDIAEDYGADWIIHDDCDCVPTKQLQDHGRHLIENCERDFIYAVRAYMYKDEGYASKMSRENNQWQPSLWAWRAHNGFLFSEDDPFVHTFDEPEKQNIWKLAPPMALLHYPWPDEQTIQRKVDFYTKIYDRKTARPESYMGKVLPLEWWMRYE